jgi:large subunit ribosomal protein L16
MIQPKNTKFRKSQKIRIKKVHPEQSGGVSHDSRISFGSYGIRASEGGWLTARQIEAARKVMRRKMKRSGRLWIRVFPDRPVTRKAIGVRMGKGKGGVSFWVHPVKVGQVLFELDEVGNQIAQQTLKSGSIKIPIKTHTIQRN